MSGGVSNPADLLRRLRARGGGVGTPARPSTARAASAGALGGSNPGVPAADTPGTRTCVGAGAASTAAALLRAAEAGAEALAEADPDLARERAETAAGLRAEAPDPAQAGLVEVLPNGTRLHYCHRCGRLASWGFGVALDRGRDGRWFCFVHQGRAE